MRTQVLGSPDVVYFATGKVYLHGDHPSASPSASSGLRLRASLGSTSLVTNDAGAVVAEQLYLPYGTPRWSTGTLPTDFTYTGQRADATGLMFYNARYYVAYLNRWIQPDTIVPQPGNPQDLNRYSYVLDNPLKYVDPSGHDWRDVGDFLAGVAYQWARSTIEGHALGLTPPDSIKAVESLAVDSDAFRAGRVFGGGVVFVQGVAEGVVGGLTFIGGIGGGAATCLETIGGGCLAGAAVAGEGAYLTVAGVASAGNGLVAAGQQATVLFAIDVKI